jgi:hypothetical protein
MVNEFEKKMDKHKAMIDDTDSTSAMTEVISQIMNHIELEKKRLMDVIQIVETNFIGVEDDKMSF